METRGGKYGKDVKEIIEDIFRIQSYFRLSEEEMRRNKIEKNQSAKNTVLYQMLLI